MGKARKTVDLIALVEDANKMFATSVNSYDRERKGMQFLVSKMLMDAKMYKGFRYLRAEDVEPGYTCGIIPDYETGKHVYPDETRIAYYI